MSMMMIMTMIIVQVRRNECFPVEHTWSWLFRLESLTNQSNDSRFFFSSKDKNSNNILGSTYPINKSSSSRSHDDLSLVSWKESNKAFSLYVPKGASTSVFADNLFSSFLLTLFRRDREGEELVLT